MPDNLEVYDAVRRGYNDLETASTDDIAAYFSNVDEGSMVGHVSNVKGMLFEQQVEATLNEQGLETSLHELTNHPDTDLSIYKDGEIAAELQLKATDDVNYINETLAEHPDIPIIATSEVIAQVDSPMVIDSGIENTELTATVHEALAGEPLSAIPLPDSGSMSGDLTSDTASEGLAEVVTDLAIPVSPIGLGLFFGLPF